uniref:C-type lectin domain-containing protein n=1 Tax=Lates calcarifer TaxID=8187 RepID=A0A4W6C4N0_LATCA
MLKQSLRCRCSWVTCLFIRMNMGIVVHCELIPCTPLSYCLHPQLKIVPNKCTTFSFLSNWSYARSWCKDQGGELAVIDDQYENDFVSSYLKDLELPTWIGLSDLLVENQYAWSDGVSAVLYTNWNDKEPNNAGGADEGCVSMHASRFFHGTWNDTKCDQAKPYICKISSGTAHTEN